MASEESTTAPISTCSTSSPTYDDTISWQASSFRPKWPACAGRHCDFCGANSTPVWRRGPSGTVFIN